MKTLTKSNGLWTGSLQKHMAVSRREMNKSYRLQQAQLARMNIVRDSQRLQLSAAETLVRLDQLKEEIKKNQYKPSPKVETLGVIPNSNPALESTFAPYNESAYGQPIYADTEAPSEYDDEEEKADANTVYPVQVDASTFEITDQIVKNAYTLPEGKLYFIEQIPPKIWDTLNDGSQRLTVDALDEIANKIKVPSETYQKIKELAYNNNPVTIKKNLRELIEVDGQKTRDLYKNNAKAVRDQLNFMY